MQMKNLSPFCRELPCLVCQTSWPHFKGSEATCGWWLVAAILDSVNREHFCHCRQFSWTVLGASAEAGDYNPGQGLQDKGKCKGISLTRERDRKGFPSGLSFEE